MNKLYPSSRHQPVILAAMLWAFLAAQAGAGVSLSPAEARRIGRQIWQNECGGTVSGLTSWNTGEDFASLGIGHFIWYPEGKRGPFEESFPRFIAFAGHHGVKLPDSLTGAATKPCPWSSRAQFQRSQQSAEMKQLRQFLADTIDLQTQFMIQRLENALPKMLEETTASNRAVVQRQFERLTKSGRGCYALIDYVNFKGEGVLHTERYAGQGWGLLQVLEEMREKGSDAPKEFARSAAAVLTRRVHNSPPERNEARWLSGWIRRVNSYSRG